MLIMLYSVTTGWLFLLFCLNLSVIGYMHFCKLSTFHQNHCTK